MRRNYFVNLKYKDNNLSGLSIEEVWDAMHKTSDDLEFVVLINSILTPKGWVRTNQKFLLDNINQRGEKEATIALLKFVTEKCAEIDSHLTCFYRLPNGKGCRGKVVKPGRILGKTKVCGCTHFAYFMSFPYCKDHQELAQKTKDYMLPQILSELQKTFPNTT